MTKSTPTLTQSGLLAVLLQRQRYRAFQLARRSAHGKRMHAAFWNIFTWARRALTAPKPVDAPSPHLNLHQANSHVSPNSITTPNSGSRFTTTCGSNIPNGSSQMANPPCASWKYSIL